jgi:nitroreductase
MGRSALPGCRHTSAKCGKGGTTVTTFDPIAAVAAATRAPSLHNSQPWRFRIRDDAIEVRFDPQRRLPAADPTGWAARIAIGAAVFNLRLAISAQGWIPHVLLAPADPDRDLLAVVSPGQRHAPTPADLQLFQAIAQRHSNRDPFFPDPVTATARVHLVTAAREEGAWLELLIGDGPLAALSEIARTANEVLMRTEAYRTELADWTRHAAAVDGVPSEAGGPRPEPQDLLPARPFSSRQRTTWQDFEGQPLIAVLGTVGDTVGDQLVAGQALQRVLLTATDHDLAVSMVSQPIEIPGAREQLRLALGRSGPPQMVLRIGYGVAGAPTPRRSVADVVDPAPDEIADEIADGTGFGPTSLGRTSPGGR